MKADLAGIYAFPDADPAVVAEAWRVLLTGSRPGTVRERGQLKLSIGTRSADDLVVEESEPRRHSWGIGGPSDASQLDSAVPPWLRCDYDPVEQRVTLRTDRYGFAPLYWRRLAGSVVFSTSALLLARVPPAPGADRDAIAELIAFDHLLGERTLARGVTALPLGHSLLLDRSGAKLQRDTGYGDIRLDASLTPRDAVPGLVSAWRDGVAGLLKRAGSRSIVVPLSGGLDSRLLAATAAELGASLSTFTFGQRLQSGGDPPDVAIARQVAQTLGVPWRFLELKDGWVSDHAALACQLTDGHLNVIHSAGVSFADDFQGSFGQAFQGGLLRLDGLAGDIVLGGSALLPHVLRETSPEARLRGLWRARSGIDGAGWRELLLPDAHRDLTARARASLQQSLTDVTADLEPTDPRWLDFWILRNRIRRFTTNGALLWRPVADSVFPFFAVDFLRLLLALHPRHRVDARLQAHFLHHGYPAMARIPWQKTGRPVARPGWRGRLAHHLSLRRMPPKFPFFDFEGAFRRTTREQELFRAHLLGGESRLSALGVFDPVAVSKLFERTVAGEERGMSRLSLLLTLALTCEDEEKRG